MNQSAQVLDGASQVEQQLANPRRAWAQIKRHGPNVVHAFSLGSFSLTRIISSVLPPLPSPSPRQMVGEEGQKKVGEGKVGGA